MPTAAIRSAAGLRPFALAALVVGCGDDSVPRAVGDSGSSGPVATTIVPPGTTGSADTTAGSSGVADDTSTGTPPDPTEPACDPLRQLADDLATAPGEDHSALIDAAIRSMVYSPDGLPAIEAGPEGTTVCVAFRGPSGQAVTLAGDFNDWAPDAIALEELSSGYYQAVVEVGDPSGLYKLVLGGDEFIGDPLARRFGWDEFGEYAQFAPMADRGHHERWPAFEGDGDTIASRTITTFVPRGATERAELPVLYMHDGQNLFSPEAFLGGWRVGETVQGLIDGGEIPPLLVVGINNTGARFDEYTPVPDVLDGMEVGGNADAYVAWLTDTVMPFVEERYPVSLQPADTGVLGSSLGGLVSLYIGLRRADRFGYAGSMSGTIDWGSLGADNSTIDLLYTEQPPTGLQIYLDSGGEPGAGCPDGGSDNYCGNVRMADALRGLGWVDEADLLYRWAPGEPHNELAWAGRLADTLREWFPGGAG